MWGHSGLTGVWPLLTAASLLTPDRWGPGGRREEAVTTTHMAPPQTPPPDMGNHVQFQSWYPKLSGGVGKGGYAGEWRTSPLYWPTLNFHGASLKPATRLLRKELGVKLGPWKGTFLHPGGWGPYWPPSLSLFADWLSFILITMLLSQWFF